VAVEGPALDVGGEVAGVHVGDRGDEGRADKRKERRKPAPSTAQRLSRGGPGAVAEPAQATAQYVGLGRLHRHYVTLSTKTPLASPSGTASRRLPMRTLIGLSNWVPASTRRRAPGTSPRRSSSRSRTESSSE